MAPAWMYYDSKQERDTAARMYEGRGKQVVLGHSMFGFKEGSGKKWRLRGVDHRGNPVIHGSQGPVNINGPFIVRGAGLETHIPTFEAAIDKASLLAKKHGPEGYSFEIRDVNGSYLGDVRFERGKVRLSKTVKDMRKGNPQPAADDIPF